MFALGGGRALASAGCSALSGYFDAQNFGPHGTSSAAGFSAGDKITVTVTDPGNAGNSYTLKDSTTSATLVSQRITSSSYTVPATTSDTLAVVVNNATGGSLYVSWSCAFTAAPTATQAVSSAMLTQNVAATAFTPVTGSGGTGPLSYSVSPALPAGLSMSSSTGTITGTPTVASASTSYTVTVTDSNGVTATASFTLTVNGAVSATQAVASTALTVNHAATAFTPVTGSGGLAPLSYSVSPALPGGLTMSSTTGAVSGTPTATSAAASYTVTVTDAGNATATASFSLTVNGAVTATQAVASKVLTVNHAATAFTPVTGGGGTAPLSYSVSPTLPAGMTMSTTTGTISGTPTAASAATTYTVTVTDSNAANATNTFSLTVNGAVTATQAVASVTVTQNHAATPFTPVVGGGGTAPLAYSVSPALPAGLAMSPTTGAISGTPTVASASTSYTVTVTDANSATATASFSLTVSAAVPAVTSVSPNSGPSIGGTSVTITGTDLSGATAVKFGAVNATAFVVNSATSITATSPPGTGAVDVTVVTPGGPSPTGAADRFTYALTATSVSLASSQNPSSFGQAVTFTATVVSGGGTPGGTVTFKDGAAILGTMTLSGSTARLTTSSLALGVHSITAAYGGDVSFAASTSPVVQQAVNVPADSIKLRAMQVAATPMIAQISGQAITGAIDTAINDGFGGNPQQVTPNGSGFRFNFAAEPDNRTAAPEQDGVRRFLAAPEQGGGRAGDPSSALAYAGVAPQPALRPASPPREWLAWIDFRGTSFERRALGDDMKGDQINAVAGLTRKLTPDVLVGLLGGYERFDYSSQAFSGRLTGDGWTVGAYLGWRFAPQMRFDAAVAYSGIGYADVAGTAAGTFTGNRWLVSGGLTGTYGWQALVLQPSARVYALWEQENSYTDTLGILQADRNFASGRASGGLKASYPLTWSAASSLAPYLGVYADYYFSNDNAALPALASTPQLHGWSARLAGGVGVNFANGTQLSAGGELGGVGSNSSIWTWRARLGVPF